MEIVSRQEAKQLGLIKYYTGMPCKRGHIAERNVASGVCIECTKERNREYYAVNRQALVERHRERNASNKDAAKEWWASYYPKNKEAISARGKRRLEENRDSILQRKRDSYYLNRETNLARAKAYRSANKPAVLANNAKRRARKKNAVPPWFDELDQFVWSEAADLAKLRFEITGIKWAADHMIPLAGRKVCGLHVAENCQVIPDKMNNQKKNKMILTERLEWLK